MCPKTAECQGENGWKHDTLKQIAGKKSADRRPPKSSADQSHRHGASYGEQEQQALGADIVHQPAAAHAPEHEQPHAAERKCQGCGAVVDTDMRLSDIVYEETVDACLRSHV